LKSPNFANLLTGLRLLLVPFLVLSMLLAHSRLAGVIFGVAVITDLLDGPLARRFGTASNRGALFDHAVDATFVTAGLATLAIMEVSTPVLPIMVAAAFVQYTLDSRALAGRHLRASRLGRYNGIAYFVLLGIPVVRDAMSWSWPSNDWVAWLAWCLVATTLVSIGDRTIALVNARRDS